MRGAIFDLDGTLADTADDLLASANAILAPAGLPLLDPVAERRFAGRGGRAMIRRSLEIAGRAMDAPDEIELTNRLYPALLAAYEPRIADKTYLYEGVLSCLDQLAGDGWRLGVCTNKPENLALMLLERLGVKQRFGAILGADTLPVRKPDPEHVLETVRRIGAAPERSIMIGDTRTDLDAARNAGLPCVLVSFGYAAEPLSELAPDHIIDRFEDLLRIVESH